METYTAIRPRMNFSLLAETFRSLTVSGDLGGRTLLPGIYNATEAVRIQNGNLTLDARGNDHAIWIFQFASDLFTIGGEGGNVILAGNAKAENVFWQTEHLASIGSGTSFKGNILAKMMNQNMEEVTVEELPKNIGRRQSNMGWPLYGQSL